jgi:CheY-like chemotaxis protein/MinD-like ATPase involved in chromosome partitioning or flagellar assembly
MAERILVVDDDLDSLKLIGLMLQRNGYEVAAANTGAQALAKASGDHPDLIILDVMMPDMNGYEVCRRLRMNVETKSIPIIMFTAKTLIDDKVAGFEAGADDYLTKPTHPSELASRVRAILSRNAQRRTEATLGASIGVLGVKGGVGASTLALNLAAARVLAGENAIVADFRPGAGTLGLSLGAADSAGMTNLLTKSVAELKPRAVETELFSHSSGLRALLSSAHPRETQTHFSADNSIAVLRIIRQLGRPVVVDLGSGYTSQVSNLQTELDLLILVIDAHPVTLTMARELIRELDGGHGDKLHVVAMTRSQSSQQPVWSEVERILGRSLNGVLAPGAELILQAYQAHLPPVMYQPAAMFSTQVIKLAEEMSVQLNQAVRNS